MKRQTLTLFAVAFAALSAVPARAQESFAFDPSTNRVDELRITSDYFAGARKTGEMLATGHVQAVSGKIRVFSDRVSRSADGRYDFGRAELTTCTNAYDDLHWKIAGRLEYREDRAIILRNAALYADDIPVLYFPYWYYPLNTDYGFRFMPGYSSKWGGYILSGYVYNIIGEKNPNGPSLGGSTYLDYRTKNGVAVGQTVRLNMGDVLGRAKLRIYHAWDRNYDRYRNHYDDSRYEYQNWGSPVDYRRYRIALDHSADLTERDSLRLHGAYLSDSQFLYDFFDRDNRDETIPMNEAAYEHRENSFAAGAEVSGPLNKFYGGTSRLPEGWLAIEPQPVFDLPVNYESQTRAGWLNRQAAEYTDAPWDSPFRYTPAKWASYQAARVDTNHRLTIPFKLWDTLAVVPRAGYRGTYYSDSGDTANFDSASGNGLYRSIFEAGFTASARATGWISDNWRHVFEPYVDYSYQTVNIEEQGRGGRLYYFDSLDRSYDWLDQFGFDGRGLPTDWHGIRPGVRNSFQRRDDKGLLHTVLDIDTYAAVPFNTTRYGADGRPTSDEDANYSVRGDREVVPGTMIRFHPDDDTTLGARAEYDCENSKAAYADILWNQRLAKSFSYYASYIGRDHRLWDYSDTPLTEWNREKANMIELGFTHDICDSLGWSPFVRYDLRRNELDEVGSWFEYRLDCLAFRLTTSYISSFTRIDGSKRESDVRVGFFIYLRAFGPSSAIDFGRF